MTLEQYKEWYGLHYGDGESNTQDALEEHQKSFYLHLNLLKGSWRHYLLVRKFYADQAAWDFGGGDGGEGYVSEARRILKESEIGLVESWHILGFCYGQYCKLAKNCGRMDLLEKLSAYGAKFDGFGEQLLAATAI